MAGGAKIKRAKKPYSKPKVTKKNTTDEKIAKKKSPATPKIAKKKTSKRKKRTA